MIAERAPEPLEAQLETALNAVREGKDDDALTALDRLVAQAMIATHARPAGESTEPALPRATQRLLAEAQQLHGAIRLGRRELPQAEDALRAALTLYETLTTDQPEPSDAEQQARTHVMLGSLLLQRARLRDARAQFATAREVVANAGAGERVTELRANIEEAASMTASIARRLRRLRLALILLAVLVPVATAAAIVLWQSGAL